MKIKEGYILREILDEFLVVSYGLRVKEDTRIITLTESAAILWKAMEKEISIEELVQILLLEFPDIPKNMIELDISSFIEKLKNGKYLENEN